MKGKREKAVIKVENLSKAYQIGQFGTGTISRDIERWWITKIRKQDDPFLKIGEANDRTKKGSSDIVWSLRDLNFEINQGDAVGIIGKNGAGKSTLLKILSRVTAPTSGSFKVRGRIASLLEVGTGFHPELTGRENIYLNGAILGMRKKEITRKLDEIIDFSGVERYIDTPVKRYSSGMYVRLAFAVAAYLESEILIVDEVLAVGDAEFQKKCLGKMSEVSRGGGRTVLFVSHNMEAMKTLCSKGILLQNGQISFKGPIADSVNQYFNVSKVYDSIQYNSDGENRDCVFIKKAGLYINNQLKNIYSNQDSLSIKLEVEGRMDICFSFEILIKDYNQSPILFSPLGLLNGLHFKINERQLKKFVLNLQLPFLASGRYYIDLMLVDSGKCFYEYVENALTLNIDANFISKTSWNFTQKRGQGSILLDKFELIECNEI